MDFSLSTEHEILRNSVRNFSTKEIQPLARDLDRREEFSLDLTRAMGGLGLFGMVIPEEYGGQGLDYLGYIIAARRSASLAPRDQRRHVRLREGVAAARGAGGLRGMDAPRGPRG